MKKLEEIIAKEKEFTALVGIYTAANALDKFLTYKALVTGRFYEMNPVADYLIRNVGAGLGLLLAAVAGNALYVGLGYGIYKEYSKLGRTLLYLVAAHQTFVAGYCLYKITQ